MAVSYTLTEGLTVGVEQLWPLLALPVAIGLLAYLIRRGEGGTRSASNRSRRLLLASRVLIVCLLVLGAMEPYTVQTRETPGEPGVTLLTDDSASMGIYPNTTDALVRDIEDEGVPVTRATIGSGSNSRLGDGVAANLQENGTVVVVSDGRVTEGRSLATAAEDAAGLNATVHSVTPQSPRTERAVTIAGPSTVSRGVRSQYTVSMEGVSVLEPVPVEVTIDGETVTEGELRPDGTLTVDHTFEALGSHRVTATLSGDDEYARNDVFYKSVRVVEQPDVLYVSQGEYPLRNYLDSLYNVSTASSVPADLDDYAAVVMQDTPSGNMGNTTALQDFVINGGGLVVAGGDNAYENGGYETSPVASMLPVRVGNATGGESNIVILVDVSGSAESGLSVQKAVALDVLDQLGDENQVGVVAFNQNAYRVSEMQALGQNRAETADKIRRLESGGATDIAVGLQGADELLDDREGTIILLSDGQDRLGPPAAVANQLGREGTRVVSVGVGKRVGVATMRQIASESGGSYFAADETERLRLLFGGSSRRYQGENLTIVTEDTFITAGVELTANPGQANNVQVKPGADYQVATADGKPAIASWRFGLGRVVSITAYDSDNTMGGLLDRPDSLVVTKSVNYAVGDPMRTQTGVTAVGDARVGRPTTLTYQGDSRPDAANISFRQVGDGRYRGEFTPREAGYQAALDTEYAANYPVEYASFGPSDSLDALVETTGGQAFTPDQGEQIASEARQKSTRVRTVQDTWDWVALLGALLLFTGEVVARRVQVYRGRTSLESGLP
ncbi:VWA domain-containing protein [Haloarcula sp. JP-Z28]|uniref:VWA domain-containing protein n=1 Tax=Haloarcula sp. JP-Z28 TaxID=2716715 RepID=UPI0014049B7B|nr:VWA domain-containing protein [Haloarcula sp. JP-Z28]NHN65404.1 VWA domain-containing protein [Haloarcula sp. JP-Z28]